MQDGTPATNETKIVLRLPPDLHLELTDWAKDDNRSLNRQIVHLLSQAAKERRAEARRNQAH